MGKTNLYLLSCLITLSYLIINPIIISFSFWSDQSLYSPKNHYLDNITSFHESQNNGLNILYPNGGETLNGTVTIQWALSSMYLGDSPWYSVFYSPDRGDNWIQLAFIIIESTYEWNTPLYETYGNNYLVKVIAESKEWVNKEDVSENPFSIDNRLVESSSTSTTEIQTDEEPDNQILLLFSLLGSFIILSGAGFTYYRIGPRLKKQKTFVELIRSSENEFLKEIRHKVVIGLDNIRGPYPLELRDPLQLESVVKASMVEYFPSTFHEDLRSELKGRTVLTLIEIAYQDPSETNPTKLAQSLKIPTPSLTREIKKLIDLQYVEAFVSTQVLQDARYRNFSITSKGVLFLSTLNEALQIAIARLKEKNT
ncbi:MAG: hypothetical protein ACFFFH_00655 [Candidatus Thorarchaeota archaeon]